MGRAVLFGLALLVYPVVSSAQGVTSRVALGVPSGATLPATCSPVYRNLFLKTSAMTGLYQCLSTDTWTAVSVAFTMPATDCTNQFVRDIATDGSGTCASVANADLAGSINPSKISGGGTFGAGAYTFPSTVAATTEAIAPTLRGVTVDVPVLFKPASGSTYAPGIQLWNNTVAAADIYSSPGVDGLTFWQRANGVNSYAFYDAAAGNYLFRIKSSGSALIGGTGLTSAIQFRGIAATDPMIKPSTTGLEFKLADDSDYTLARAKSFRLSSGGALCTNGSVYIGLTDCSDYQGLTIGTNLVIAGGSNEIRNFATQKFYFYGSGNVGVGIDTSTDNTLKIRSRAHDADGQLSAGSVRGNAVTFANRPATPVEGMLVAITDSSTATWGDTITGGGANHVLAYYNGTNWTVAAK